MWLRLLIPALVLVASTAEATPITYTDRAAFELALGQAEVFDFSNPGFSTDNSIGMHLLSYQGLTVYVDTSNGQTAHDAVAAGQIINPTNVVQFVFTSPRSAFGFDVQTSGTFMLGVFGADGGWQSGGLFHIGHSGFFGAILGHETSGLALFPWSIQDGDQQDQRITVDNLTTNRVPEPSTLLLFGLALILMYRRRFAKGGRRLT